MPGGGVVHVPVSWLADYVALPADLDPRELGEAFVRIGLEVETVESGADGISGPVVVGRLVSFDAESQKNGKTIRWCRVDVGPEHNDEDGGRGIVCGAANFAVGDLVVVSLPDAILPGGFAIAARKTYGHVSDGMICSVRELGLGDEHDGILVLPAGSAQPGADALDTLGLREAVLTIAVTPDRGYCLSMRGLAREAAGALGVEFRDAWLPRSPCLRWTAAPMTWCWTICVAATSSPCGRSSGWTRRRPARCGCRRDSGWLACGRFRSPSTSRTTSCSRLVSRCTPTTMRWCRGRSWCAARDRGEKLTTLDGVQRTLDPADLLITDDSGPIGLAGVMGGASTEIGDATSTVLLEAAHFVPSTIVGCGPPPPLAERGGQALRARRGFGGCGGRSAAMCRAAGGVRRCDRQAAGLHRGFRRRPDAGRDHHCGWAVHRSCSGHADLAGDGRGAADRGRLCGDASGDTREQLDGRGCRRGVPDLTHPGRSRRGGGTAAGLRADPVDAAEATGWSWAHRDPEAAPGGVAGGGRFRRD